MVRVIDQNFTYPLFPSFFVNNLCLDMHVMSLGVLVPFVLVLSAFTLMACINIFYAYLSIEILKGHLKNLGNRTSYEGF